jgi:hypothetical protein
LVHKVLITVKTYPTLSSKYEESVCTAGFTENGNFIRIYPIPFRKLPYENQYKKYDFIEIDLKKNESDFRPESYEPTKLNVKIKPLGHLDTARNWLKRKEIVLTHIRKDIKTLIKEAKDKEKYTSLAVFKPKEVLDFSVTSSSRVWDAKKTKILEQENLFEKRSKIIRKLPYKFLFKFTDKNNTVCNLMIEDWEIGQLYWKCLDRRSGNEEKAISDVREKYYNDLAKTKDLYFFLGTTRQHHLTSRNPFMIIGLFYPKKEPLTLFEYIKQN